MAIDFGAMGAAAPATSTPLTDVTPAAPTAGITLDLNKGDMLNISKTNPGLTRVRLGAGWDVAEAGNSFDLDIAAFICGPNGKITSGADVVYFNNKTSQGVTLNGDNRTGAGDGDDETIDIDLSAVPASVTKIAFAVVAATFLFALLSWLLYFGVTGDLLPRGNNVYFKDSYTMTEIKIPCGKNFLSKSSHTFHRLLVLLLFSFLPFRVLW